MSWGIVDIFSAVSCVDDMTPVHVQQNDDDETVLQLSVSLASDCPHVFGAGITREPTILSRPQRTE